MLRQQHQHAPVEQQANDPELVQETTEHIAASEAIDNIENQPETHHHHPEPDCPIHQHHWIALEGIVPKGVFLKLRQTEVTAVNDPENHAR